MGIPKKKCIYCGRWFLPDRRVRKQKRCFREECRRAANRRKVRNWIKLHPDFLVGRVAKVRAWAKGYPDYWRQYRRGHPDYCLRDNRRRTAALRKARRSAKQTSIRAIAVEKLRKVRDLDPPNCSAKQTPIERRVEGLMDYLFWTVKVPCSAKQTGIEYPQSP